jgi:molybdopterin molybdotransferase
MQGRDDLDRPRVRATLDRDVRTPENKRTFVRVTLAQQDGLWRATPSGGQGSHVLSALAAADGLAVVDAGTGTARAGQPVVVLLLVDA